MAIFKLLYMLPIAKTFQLNSSHNVRVLEKLIGNITNIQDGNYYQVLFDTVDQLQEKRFTIIQGTGHHLKNRRAEAFIIGYIKYENLTSNAYINFRAYPSVMTMAFILIGWVTLTFFTTRDEPTLLIGIFLMLFSVICLWYIVELFRQRDDLYRLVEHIILNIN